MLQMEKLKKDEKVANSFEMTMKEADIDQNGIQTEDVSALIDLNVFCIIFVLDGLTIQPDFVIFFIGVSTPGKNRT